MASGVYIVLLLGTTYLYSSVPEPYLNPWDSKNLNIDGEEGNNERRSFESASQLEQFQTPTVYSSHYSNNGNNDGYGYIKNKHIEKYNRYDAKDYGYGYKKYRYGKNGYWKNGLKASGNWSLWSACSITYKTCGGGWRQRKRYCNKRSNGGRECRERTTDNEICNTKKCRIHQSNSNPNEARVTHINLNLEIDFQNQVLFGSVLLQIQNLKKENLVILLDCKHLDIYEVSDAELNKILRYWIIIFDTLIIFMPTSETSYQIKISYSTTNKTRYALQWLKETETLGKRKPFFFSTCSPMNCRTMLPCQDTPLVRFTYNATITIPGEITPVMSAVKKSAKALNDGKWIYVFEQKVPIPSYLIAIAAGNLKSEIIGPRSVVWAEPEILKSAAKSLRDIEKWLKAAENIVGPYEWEKLDIVIVPKFPLLGLEHPNTMFLSTDLEVLGSGIVIHEIIHSWAGNLVTNLDWGHRWLTEGITTFIEMKFRYIFEIQNNSMEQFEIPYMKQMKSRIETLINEDENDYSKLVWNFTEFYSKPAHQTPWDAFYSIPYTKGASLMWYLEDIVGKQNMDLFLKSYFSTFKKQSIDTSMFETHFKNVLKNANNVNEIDWKTWFYSPGLPPYIKEFDDIKDPLVENMRNIWKSHPNINEIASLWKNLSYHQQMMVLSTWENGLIEGWINDEPLEFIQIIQLRELDALCNISSSPLQAIKTFWALIGLEAHIYKVEDSGEDSSGDSSGEDSSGDSNEDSSGDEDEDKETKYALKIIEEIGYVFHLKRLYYVLYQKDSELAVETFEKHKVTMPDMVKWNIEDRLERARVEDKEEEENE